LEDRLSSGHVTAS